MQGGVSVSAPEFADLNLSIPPLHRWLDAVIGASPEDSVAPQHGPRRWWPGPLDVEGLALGALQAVATALHRYPAGRARFSVTSAPVAASFNSLGHLRIAGVTPDGFAELSGFFPCRDGWIRLHANYPHHAAAVRSVLGAGTRTEVVDALAGCSAEGAEATLRATGGVAVALRDPATWQASAPGAAVASEPWIRFALEEPRAGPRRAVRALSELRVIDLTRVVAGPTGTRLLGALGRTCCASTRRECRSCGTTTSTPGSPSGARSRTLTTRPPWPGSVCCWPRPTYSSPVIGARRWTGSG